MVRRLRNIACRAPRCAWALYGPASQVRATHVYQVVTASQKTRRQIKHGPVQGRTTNASYTSQQIDPDAATPSSKPVDNNAVENPHTLQVRYAASDQTTAHRSMW